MRIEKFSCENFRNLDEVTITPHPGTNIIYGENAQGKTNLIEGMWMFTGAKSFRCSSDKDLVGFGSEFSRLNMEFFAGERHQSADITIEGRRSASLNGVKLRAAGELAGNFCAVVFSPTHLSLIKDGPGVRRRMMDIAIGQLKPNYVAALHGYMRALSQRNSILKDARFYPELYDMLENFEQEIARFGGTLISERKKYMSLLSSHITDIYGEISDNRETLRLEYVTRVESEDAKEASAELLQQLKNSRQEDTVTGSTSVGPHREDMEFTLSGISARSFGSQGQQRSCVLALKLTEALVVEKTVSEKPVMLFDDVMSELDEMRQEKILNRFADLQVFVTCCERDQIKRLAAGKTFKMQGGKIFEG